MPARSTASLEDTIEKAVKGLLSKKALDDGDKLRLDALNTAIKFLAVQKRGSDDESEWGADLRDEPKPTEEV